MFVSRNPHRNRLLATTVLVSLAWQASAQEATLGGIPIQLDDVVVEGASYETEDSGSYTTDQISVGEKDVRKAREIPQSTTVVTRERLNDSNATSLDTVLKRTPGVVVLTNDDGRSSLYSRGFEFDTLYFNGLPAPLSSIYGTQPDMAIVDHIEILRGPAGLFAGAGEPAGAINMRLKQAPDKFQARGTVTAGSWNNRRIELDAGGPLNAAGTIRGRLVGAFGAKDSFVDVVDNQVGVFYGTLQADLTENTTATFSVSHQKRDITPFNGLPTLADGTLLDLDRSTFVGAKWNDFNSAVTDYIGEIEHKFDDGGHAKASFRYSQRDVDFLYGYAATAAAANGNVNGLRYLGREFEENSLALDAHISKPFEIGGMENNVIVGIDYRRVGSDMIQATAVIPGTWNIYDWNSNVAAPNPVFGNPTETDLDQYGVYGQWRIKPIDRLTLVGGGRLTWYDTSILNPNGTTAEADIDAKLTPYAGIIYDLTDNVSAYASYTQIFQPQTNLTTPRTGSQVEVGLKAELLEGVNATAAYFHMVDRDRAVSNPDDLTQTIGLGEATLQGLELEATGAINPNWQVMAGYTYTDTQYTDTRTLAGPEFYTPEHMVQLWTKYNFDDRHGILDKAFVGAGVKAFSSFKNITRTVNAGTGVVSALPIEAPGYVVVDLQAGYKFNEHLTATLAVTNLFDEKYYERVGGTSVFNFYGEPRGVTFSISGAF